MSFYRFPFNQTRQVGDQVVNDNVVAAATAAVVIRVPRCGCKKKVYFNTKRDKNLIENQFINMLLKLLAYFNTV